LWRLIGGSATGLRSDQGSGAAGIVCGRGKLIDFILELGVFDEGFLEAFLKGFDLAALEAAIELDILKHGLLLFEEVEEFRVGLGEAINGGLRSRVGARIDGIKDEAGFIGDRRCRGSVVLGEAEAGQKDESEKDSHELAPDFDHAGEKIDESADIGDEDDEEEPEDFLRGVGLAGGAVVDHPNPEEDADEFEAAGAGEEEGEGEGHGLRRDIRTEGD
jgi:hypothetical protein